VPCARPAALVYEFLLGAGELAPLLGGVLKGEALRSLASADASGALRPPGVFANPAGLLGTCGFAARFTAGGRGFVAGLVCSGICGGEDVADLLGSGAGYGELLCASIPGVPTLLAFRELVLLAASPVRSGVIGERGLAPMNVRRSREIFLVGGRGGEFTVTTGGDGCVACVVFMDDGRMLVLPSTFLLSPSDDGLPFLADVPLPTGGLGTTGVDGGTSLSLPRFSNLARSEDVGLIDVVSGPSPVSSIVCVCVCVVTNL
jgi:hypothetical protein